MENKEGKLNKKEKAEENKRKMEVREERRGKIRRADCALALSSPVMEIASQMAIFILSFWGSTFFLSRGVRFAREERTTKMCSCKLKMG